MNQDSISTGGRRKRRVGVRAALAALACAAGFAAATSAAQAQDFGIADFDGQVGANAAGDPFTQAGGHPFSASTVITFESYIHPQLGLPFPNQDIKDIHVELPPGLLGNPQNIPECTQEDFAGDVNGPKCPPETIVGKAYTQVLGIDFYWPIFNLASPPDTPATFGFFVLVQPVILSASLRSGSDYGLDVDIPNVSQGLPLAGTGVTFWGVPADPAHDNERCGTSTFLPTCPQPVPSSAPREAFLTLPTACTEPGVGLETRLRAASWANPDDWKEASFFSHLPPAFPAPPEDRGPQQGPTGCERVPFDADAKLLPESKRAASPTGLDVELTIPQDGLLNPDGVAPAHLKRAEVTLPEGMAINPSAADGLGSCAPDEIGLDTTDDPTCPANSIIGTVEIDTPLLENPMKGSIYLAKQNDNPFNSTLAIYAVAKGPGLILKLPGKISPDEQTGQLVTTFDDNPQLPFTSFKLRFKGGERAPLVNPPTCGIYEITAELVPWSAADPDNPTPDEIVTSTSRFVVDRGPDGGPCQAGDPNEPADPADLADRPFEPELKAGLRGTVAGSFTPFTFQLKRPDGHQEILATEVTPPEGVTARLAGIPFCSEADVEANSCGPESQIGTTLIGAGAGTNPFYTSANPGRVYLAGPFDPDEEGPLPEAPLSMLISEPVIAGPLDLTDITVRAAIYVDPETAQLRVVSQEIPSIADGIPLRIRDIRIRMDREAFTIAPTDCSEKQVEAVAYGSHGAEADLSNRFQVGECASLGFKPKLTFQATGGKKATKRNAHPGLKANLVVPGADAYSEGATRGSQANIKRVQVTLPKGLFLDQASPALTDPCTREEYEQNDCPASSKVGTAIAHTPLLDEPLQGPVYLRTSSNPLPDLVADLDGLVDIDLVGAVSQSKQRIRNTFQLVPDVPVSSFELRLAGGAKGLLVNSNTGKGLCGKGRRQVNVAMRAHNDRAHSYATQMKAACGKNKARKARAKQPRRKVKRLRRT